MNLRNTENPLKYLKERFFSGSKGRLKTIGSHTDAFPPLLEMKQAFEQVTGKRLEKTTTDAVAVEMTVLQNLEVSPFPIAAGETIAFRLNVVARQTAGVAGTAGDSAKFVIAGLIKRVSNTTTLVGLDVEDEIKDAAFGGSVAVVANNTDDELSIKVTGEASKTIKWQGYLEYQVIS